MTSKGFKDLLEVFYVGPNEAPPQTDELAASISHCLKRSDTGVKANVAVLFKNESHEHRRPENLRM